MKLAGRSDEGKEFDPAHNFELRRCDRDCLERNATLCGRADSTIVLVRQRYVTAGAIVPVFLHFGLTRPDRVVRVVVRRQPDPGTEHLPDNETNRQYFCVAHTRHLRSETP